MYIPNTLWTWAFLLVTFIQALVSLALEGYIFGKWQVALHPNAKKQGGSNVLTIPTYLSLLIFGFIYELILVYDALQGQNTIQVIGIVIMNLGILVYTAIQKDQIKEAFTELMAKGLIEPEYWQDIRIHLIIIPCMIALGTALLAFIAWKLYDEFAWKIYKQISADLRLKRRYLVYQIYIALLKFDFFLFLGFEVQFLVIVVGTTDIEFALTIASIPVTIVVLLVAAWCTKHENIYGMVATILTYFGALAYFLFKLIRMYADSSRKADYIPARRTLSVFAVITIILLLITIVIASWCMANFGKGLRPHVARTRSKHQPASLNDSYSAYSAGYAQKAHDQYYMDSVRLDPRFGPQRLGGGSRMEID